MKPKNLGAEMLQTWNGKVEQEDMTQSFRFLYQQGLEEAHRNVLLLPLNIVNGGVR